MNDKKKPMLAARVLTYQGRVEWASENDEDLVPHLQEISRRYEELKGVYDFMTAKLMAKSEWIEKLFQDGSE